MKGRIFKFFVLEICVCVLKFVLEMRVMKL